MARLLVIEDNPANLELMTYLLHAFGHTTLTAGDGEEGLALTESGNLDLIVCDVHLPRMDGYEVAKRLKAHPSLRRIPLVAVTALAMVGDRDKVLAAGFDGYIAKPLEPQTFVAEVERFLSATAGLVVARASVTATHTPAAAPARVSEAHVLMVDDSATNRELARASLEPYGYRVSLAVSVEQALTVLEREPVDLIVSDLHMPDADGLELLRFVRGSPRFARTPFLMVSASLWGERDRERALAMGATAFLQRPVDPEQWLAEVAACLATKERADGDDTGG